MGRTVLQTTRILYPLFAHRRFVPFRNLVKALHRYKRKTKTSGEAVGRTIVPIVCGRKSSHKTMLAKRHFCLVSCHWCTLIILCFFAKRQAHHLLARILCLYGSVLTLVTQSDPNNPLLFYKAGTGLISAKEDVRSVCSLHYQTSNFIFGKIGHAVESTVYKATLVGSVHRQ